MNLKNDTEDVEDSNATKKTSFDAIVQLLGYGRFQIVALLLGSFTATLAGATSTIAIFVVQQEKYRCYIPSCDTNTTTYSEDFLTFTTPWDNSTGRWSECTHYTSTSDEGCHPTAFDSNATDHCSKWVYDREVLESTASTEYGLSCESASLAALPGTIYQLGILPGALLMGYISDTYGRKVAILASGATVFVSSVLCPPMPTLWSFLLLIFFMGVGNSGLYQCSFVAALEYCSNRWKTFNGVVINTVYCFGELFTVLVGYLFRKYKYIYASVALLCVPLVAYIWVLPESARWLLSKGRIEEAKSIIDKAAKTNGVDSPCNMLDTVKEDTSDSEIKITPREIWNLLRKYPNIRLRFFIVSFSWTVCSLVYFGFSYNVGNMAGSMYANLAITFAIEIPGNVAGYAILQRFGRKGTHVLVFLICGITCVVSAFLPKDYVLTMVILSAFGKFAITITFTGVNIYAGEIFPTSHRTIGIAGCLCLSRIGSSMAPVVTYFATIYPPLPLLVFGSLCVAAGFLVILLPETLGLELPQTLEDSENLGKGVSTWQFGFSKTVATVDT